LLTSVDAVLAHLPLVIVDEATAERLCHGAPVPAPAVGAPWRTDQRVRIRKSEGDLIAIGRMAVDSETAQGRPGPFVIRVDAVLAETGDGSRED